MSDEQLSPFRVNKNEGRYLVVDDSEQTVRETMNAVTAEHYVDLLHKAFKLAFKLGARQARVGK